LEIPPDLSKKSRYKIQNPQITDALPGSTSQYVGSVVLTQIEIYTAEPLVPDPTPFEVEIAIA
jgi:hypothetical protein